MTLVKVAKIDQCKHGNGSAIEKDINRAVLTELL